MAEDIVAKIIFRAVDEASRKIKDVRDELGATATEAEASSGKWNAAAGLVSKFALSAAAAGVVAGGVAVKMASDWEDSTLRIANNTAMTNRQLEEMRASVMRLGQGTNVPLDSLASGFEKAANAGYQGQQAFHIVQMSMKASVETGSDLASTVDVVTGALKQFQLPASDAGRVLGIFMRAAAEGDVRLPDLVTNFNKVGAMAGAMRLPLSQTAAAMSTLTRFTHDASQAQTLLYGMLAHVENVTAPAQKEFEALSKASGIDLVGSLAKLRDGTIDLTTFMGQMREALHNAGLSTGEANAELYKLFGGLRGGQAAVLLMNQGWRDYNKIARDTAGSADTVQKQWGRSTDNLSFQLGKLNNIVHEIAVTVGGTLLPVITAAVKEFSRFISGLQQGNSVAQRARAIWNEVVGAVQTVIAAWDKATNHGKELQRVAGDMGQAFGTLRKAVHDILEPLGLAGDRTTNARNRMDALQASLEVVVVALRALGVAMKVTADITGGLALAIQAAIRVVQVIISDFQKAGTAAHNLGQQYVSLEAHIVSLYVKGGQLASRFLYLHDVIGAVGAILTWFSGILGNFLAALGDAIHNVPVLGGIFDGLGNVLLKVAAAFGHVKDGLGAIKDGIPSYLGLTHSAIVSTDDYGASLLAAAQKAHQTSTAISGAGTAASKADPVHHRAVHHMVTDAELLAQAWKHVGEQVGKTAGTIAGLPAFHTPSTGIGSSSGRVGSSTGLSGVGDFSGGTGSAGVTAGGTLGNLGGNPNQGSQSVGRGGFTIAPLPTFGGGGFDTSTIGALDSPASKAIVTLAQHVSDLITVVSGQQQREAAVFQASVQVTESENTAQLDELKAIDSATQAQTAVIQAQAGVTLASGAGTLAAVRDQGAIIQAQGAIAAAATAADRAVAQDQLRIAQETYQMDQEQARWDQVIATDQLKIALDRQKADAAASAYTRTIDAEKIQVAQANLVLVQAQNQLAVDQLSVLSDLVGAFTGNDYTAMIHGDLTAIGAAQQNIESITSQMQASQQAAALSAQQWATQISQDQQQLALDTASKDQNSQDWQIRIGLDTNQLQRDTLAAANQGNALTGETNSLLAGSNQSLRDVLAELKGFLASDAFVKRFGLAGSRGLNQLTVDMHGSVSA